MTSLNIYINTRCMKTNAPFSVKEDKVCYLNIIQLYLEHSNKRKRFVSVELIVDGYILTTEGIDFEFLISLRGLKNSIGYRTITCTEL